jgi:hypothetical protein
VVVVGLNANDTPRCGNVFFGAILYQEPNVFTRQARDKHSNMFEKERFLFKRFCSHLELSVDGKVVGSPVLPPHSMNTFVVMAHA